MKNAYNFYYRIPIVPVPPCGRKLTASDCGERVINTYHLNDTRQKFLGLL